MSLPTAPILVEWPVCAQTAIEFFWDPPTQGAPFEKYTLACSAISYSQDVSGDVTKYTVTGLTAGTNYNFTITATNATGTGPVAAFPQVAAGILPFGPSQATASTVNASTAIVTWTPSTIANQAPVRWYIVTAQPSTAGASTLIKTEYGYRTSTFIKGISTNTYYRFLVQGVASPGYCPPFAYTSNLGFGITNLPFSPNSLTGMQIWLDGSDTTKLYTNTSFTTNVTTNGQSIAGWIDKSSNAYRFLQPTSSNCPSYTTNTLNGNSVVTFNNSYLTSASTFGLYTASNGGGSFFTVFLTTSNDSQRFLMTYQNQVFDTMCVSETEIGYDTGGGTGVGNFGFHKGCSAATLAPANTISNSAATLMAATLDTSTATPSNVAIFKNGTATAIQQDSTGFYSGTSYPAANNARSTIIGARASLKAATPVDAYHAGYIGELMWFNRPQTPFDRQKVEGYLGWKWGLQGSLPATHPFKSAAPAAATVFSPSSFSSMQLWLDGADPLGTGTAPANGTSITTWANKSGAGSNATSAGTAPTYLSASNAVSFSGSGYYTTGYTASSSNESVFVVFNVTTGSLLLGASGNGGRNFSATSSNVSADLFNVSGANTYTTSNSVSFNTTALGELITSNQVMTAYVNGGSNAATATRSPTGGLTSLIGRALDNGTTPVGTLQGRVYEILAYNRLLSTDDRQTVEGYLAWKWGLQGRLPLTHPYYRIGPAASNGTPPIDFVADFPSAIGTVTPNYPAYTGSNYTYGISLNGLADLWTGRNNAPILYKAVQAASNWTMEAEIQIGPAGIPNNFVGGLVVYPNTDGSTVPMHVGWTYWSGNKPTFEFTGAGSSYGTGTTDSSSAFASTPTIGTDYVGIRLIKTGNVFTGQFKFPLTTGSWSNFGGGANFTWTSIPSTIRVGLLTKSGTSNAYQAIFRNVSIA